MSHNENLLSQLASFPWGSPRRIPTKNGEWSVMKMSPPTEGFWSLWRAHKDDVKSEGVSAANYQGAWEASWWLPATFTAELKEQFLQLLKTGNSTDAFALINRHAITQASSPASPAIIAPVVLSDAIKAKLKSYQIPAAAHLVEILLRQKGALDASEMGTGKTYAAIAAALECGFKIFVVAPLAALPGWSRAATHFDHPEVLIGAVNYDLARVGKWITTRPAKRGRNSIVIEHVQCPYLARVETSKNGKRVIDFTWSLPEKTLLVFDEAHYTKNYKTQNANLLMSAAKSEGVKFLCVSGTIAENTLKFRAVGEALGLYEGKGFFSWARKYGCENVDIPGRRNAGKTSFNFTGNKYDLERLHKVLFPALGNRLRKKDIPSFPSNQIIAESVDINSAAAPVNDLWDEWEASCEGGVPDLGKLVETRMASEHAKIVPLVEWAQELEDEGYSVVIFGTYLETLNEIATQLATPVVIRGGQNMAQREALRKQFQDNTFHYAVVQVRAGSVSLDLDDQLEHGRPRVALILPVWSAQDFIQATGRIHRAGTRTPAVQYVVYASNVKAEEAIRKKLEKKVDHLEALNDGDFQPDTGRVKKPSLTQTDPAEGEVIFADGFCVRCGARIPLPFAKEYGFLCPSCSAPAVEIEPSENETFEINDPRPPLEAGIYFKDGTVYKVQQAVYGSGSMYAKKLVMDGQKPKFVFGSCSIFKLTPEDRMTLEQAKEFGSVYGICSVCGRILTDEKSIEEGIGPVCAGRL